MMRRRGFTLLELVLVLLILGILAGATITLVTELAKQKHREETKKALMEVKEALIGYAGINHRLPWADTDGDGRGDDGEEEGNLPFVDIGLGGVDSWRKPYRYHVHGKLPAAGSIEEFCGVLQVLSTNPSGECPRLIINGSSTVVEAAVILSQGENGALDGENGDGDGVYETKSPTEDFDDLVAFLNPNMLWSKLCEGVVQQQVTLDVLNVNCSPYLYIYDDGSRIGSVGYGTTGTFNVRRGSTIGLTWWRLGWETTCCSFTINEERRVRVMRARWWGCACEFR